MKLATSNWRLRKGYPSLWDIRVSAAPRDPVRGPVRESCDRVILNPLYSCSRAVGLQQGTPTQQYHSYIYLVIPSLAGLQVRRQRRDGLHSLRYFSDPLEIDWARSEDGDALVEGHAAAVNSRQIITRKVGRHDPQLHLVDGQLPCLLVYPLCGGPLACSHGSPNWGFWLAHRMHAVPPLCLHTVSRSINKQVELTLANLEPNDPLLPPSIVASALRGTKQRNTTIGGFFVPSGVLVFMSVLFLSMPGIG